MTSAIVLARPGFYALCVEARAFALEGVELTAIPSYTGAVSGKAATALLCDMIILSATNRVPQGVVIGVPSE